MWFLESFKLFVIVKNYPDPLAVAMHYFQRAGDLLSGFPNSAFKTAHKGGEEGSGVRSSCCSCRGSGSRFQSGQAVHSHL